MKQLVSIDMISGVNEEGKGFVTVSCVSDKGDILIGQLPPKEVRELGQTCFEAGEAAEVDAIIFNLLKTKFNLPDNAIAAFIIDIRNAREE
jgi:hypothetical protein